MLSAITARVWAALIGIGVVFLLAAIALHMWREGQAAKANERVSTNQAQAGQHTAGVAGNTIVETSTKAAESEHAAQEGQDAINHAEAGNSNDAADLAVCRMRTYRDSERCRKLRALHP